MLAAQTDPKEPNDENPGLAGVYAGVSRGRVVSSAPEIVAKPSTWAIGTPEAWFDLAIDGRIDDLRIGGERPQLALSLATGIHIALFGNR